MTTTPRSAVRRLALARVISLTGAAAAFAALNYVIYQRTHSPAWVAAALFLTFGVVGIASIFAGSLGDRFDRKRVLIASDLAGAACFAAMALVREPVWLLAIAFCSALAESPFFAASTAAIPNLVDDDDVAWANGTLSIGTNAGILIGPLIGGALVATVGAGAVFGMNAASFVVSATLVFTVSGSFSGRRDDASEHRGMLAGFRFVWRDRVLRAVALAWIPLTLGLGMTMVADVPLVAVFGAGAVGYGALVSAWGGGSIAGSLLGRTLNRRTEPLAFALGAALAGAMGVMVGLSPWFWGVLAAVFVMGIGDGTQVVAQQGIMQRRTPDAVRSRVSAAIDAVAHTSLGLSYIVAGPVVAALGPRVTYVLGGAVATLAVVVAIPMLRSRREPDLGTPSEPTGAEPASVAFGYPSGETEATASTR
jgi:MFS family permease